MRTRVLSLLGVAGCLMAAEQARADPADEIIVKHAATQSAPERTSSRARSGVTFARKLSLPGVEVVKVRDRRGRGSALARLQADPDVVWAEANGTATAVLDPQFSSLWGMENTGQTGGTPGADISVRDAWRSSRGLGVTVGVVDSGVDLDHQDLRMGSNPGERGGDRENNGIDDDANGYIDDWQGWDWISWRNLASDEFGHGTHISGTIAAPENGVGVVGVAPEARVLGLRALNRLGGGSFEGIAGAFDYAGDLGLKVVNASLSLSGQSFAVQDAITSHPDTLYVVPSGNTGSSGAGFPCAYPYANVICVGASNHLDDRAQFSNWGPPSVDLLAPGEAILSTWPGNTYESHSGTSAAAPHVVGAAALIFAAKPGITVAGVRAALLDSVDHPPGVASYSVTGGRLNAAAALAAAGAQPFPAPASTTTVSLSNGVVVVRDPVGVANRLTIEPFTHETDGVLITETGGGLLKAGGGCTLWAEDILHPLGDMVFCPGQSFTRIDVFAGGGEDTVNYRVPSSFGFVLGEAGDDTLTAQESAAGLAGGPGDDLLRGGEGDQIIGGGPGIDTVDYTGHSSEPVDVSLDGKANDGVRGVEHDNVQASVENIRGSGHGGTLRGSPRANRLIGGAGPDALFGRRGPDVLLGFGDNDIFVTEGDGPDLQIDCGSGKNDITFADRDDVFTRQNGPEDDCEWMHWNRPWRK